MEADIAREKFESFVNSEECKTKFFGIPSALPFESFVNSEECKTGFLRINTRTKFESFVNSEECKTTDSLEYMESSV